MLGTKTVLKLTTDSLFEVANEESPFEVQSPRPQQPDYGFVAQPLLHSDVILQRGRHSGYYVQSGSVARVLVYQVIQHTAMFRRLL